MIRVEHDGGVVSLSLAEPARRNPLSRRTMAELDDALAAADADTEVRAVVLRGDGPAFCAGLDLAEAAGGDMLGSAQALVALQRRILSIGVPVLVRVHGPARAGALGLLAAADVVVAAEEVDFAFPEVRIGVTPAVISATLLPRLDPRAASELMLTGRPFSASDAQRIGLLTRSVPGAELDATIAESAAQIAGSDRAAIAATKGLLAAPLLRALDADGPALAELSARFFARAAAARSATD